jgi:hypothetical protein
VIPEGKSCDGCHNDRWISDNSLHCKLFKEKLGWFDKEYTVMAKCDKCLEAFPNGNKGE